MLRDVVERGIRTGFRGRGRIRSDGFGVDGAGVTPGGILTFGDRERAYQTIPFGRSHIVEQDETTDAPTAGAAPPVSTVFDVDGDTIYDLASMTKTIATAASLMKLGVDTDQPVAALIPELKTPGSDRITLAHLLGHTSGFPAHFEFFRRLLAGERPAGNARDSLLAMVTATPLVAPPGEREIYSDLGYITLGFAIERLTGKRLDQAVEELVTGPLGMTETFYVNVDASADDTDGTGTDTRSSSPPLHRIAPTEVCPYRGLVRGEVHDDNAHAAGGIMGHAGLFATAGDVARFAQAMLQVLDGRAVAGFAPEVVRHFAYTTSGADAIHTLGWDRPSPPPTLTNVGDLWPRTSIGHMGFTGTCMWLDPEGGRYAILLTNRVHPSRDPTGIKAFRRAVMDEVARQFAT